MLLGGGGISSMELPLFSYPTDDVVVVTPVPFIAVVVVVIVVVVVAI
jgi:hypothetical protein